MPQPEPATTAPTAVATWSQPQPSTTFFPTTIRPKSSAHRRDVESCHVLEIICEIVFP